MPPARCCDSIYGFRHHELRVSRLCILEGPSGHRAASRRSAAAMFVRNSAILAACAAGAASAMPLPHGAAPLPHRPVAPCSRMQCPQPVASARPDIVGAADARGPCAGMPMRLRGGDRKYCIAGNWKMNPATLDEATKLATEVRRQRSLCRCESIRGRAAAPCERACCMQHDGAVTRQKRCGRRSAVCVPSLSVECGTEPDMASSSSLAILRVMRVCSARNAVAGGRIGIEVNA